jgi:Predicted metal-binding integral membrane protein (DUF2182)
MTSAPAMTAVRTTAAAAVTATLGLAAGCWVVSVWQVTGMDMGVATRLGSFGFSAAVWVAMMAAMMLPGAAAAVARAARAGGVRGAAVRRVVPGGLGPGGCRRVCGLPAARDGRGRRSDDRRRAYELTPVKRHFRRRCRETAGPGLGSGLCYLGSSTGLMAMLVAVGAISITWMAVITVVACAQKLLRQKRPSTCRWRWPSPCLVSGSFWRLRRFRAHPADVRPQPAAWATPSGHEKKHEGDQQ